MVHHHISSYQQAMYASTGGGIGVASCASVAPQTCNSCKLLVTSTTTTQAHSTQPELNIQHSTSKSSYQIKEVTLLTFMRVSNIKYPKMGCNVKCFHRICYTIFYLGFVKNHHIYCPPNTTSASSSQQAAITSALQLQSQQFTSHTRRGSTRLKGDHIQRGESRG